MSISTVEARKKFKKVINRVANDKRRLIITRYGEAIVAIIPIEDARLLRSLEDKVDLDAARKALRRKKTISWDSLKTELGL
jgi:prevent-host-death family protein